MTVSGMLTKMTTDLQDIVQYYLVMDGQFLHMNQLIGKSFELQFKSYQCMTCQKNKKIWRQGRCYDCFSQSPQTAEWIIRPELSQAHLDIEDRDLDYEKKVQLQPHYVYLANSSNAKVGVTRGTQVPTRWIDQGAHEALLLAKTPNRYLAGVTEVALKEHVADKTNWRKMLTNQIQEVSLQELKNILVEHLPEEVQSYVLQEEEVTHIHFPVEQYPEKVKSVSLQKTPHYTGKLIGIKGQYLLFEDGHVFNVRNHEGYVIDLQIA